MSALPPRAGIALAVRLLQARGFTALARNERGDSVYLTSASGMAVLRVSNHGRTPAQRRKHPEVTTSLVVREPKNAAQIEAMVSAAMRAMAADASTVGPWTVSAVL